MSQEVSANDATKTPLQEPEQALSVPSNKPPGKKSLPYKDYVSYNANLKALPNMAKIEAVPIQLEKEITVDMIKDKLVDWVPKFKTDNSYELQETRELDENVLEENKKNQKKLTYENIVGQSGHTNVGDFVDKQTEDFYDKLKGDSKSIKLDYLNFKKNFIQCSNLVEFYDFLDDKRKWVFCRIQRCHDAKEHSNRLKIFKKKDDKQTCIFEVYVSHKDVYNFASNIAAIPVGQYLFTVRIEKEGNNYTLL